MPKKRDITKAEVELSLRLGLHLRDLRLERGLSQEQVATRAGISAKTYQKYEHGESRPGTPMNLEFFTMRDLCAAFGIGISELLDIDGLEDDDRP
ncbi:helix-turn-helix transcriptional regulator [Paratractidigestivibacter sp.]|uniref:helix-turn-helix domain-containing protein n=1 Tax=Paratractidigestivibacter sp. TaxID=2847316 RepID=UPI002ABDE0AD|nr:helix-turn-helix transcriptional regulator [Paratractidigestivibacter sp.]